MIDREELNHCLVRISTFSSLPYIFKRFFYYPDDFSQDVVCQQIESNPFLEVVPIRNDRFYKKMIKEMGTDTAKSSVIAFYYTLGAHVSWNVDEKCQYHAPPFNSILPPGRSCLFLLSEMVRLLKEKNLYDQTAIIVCSDHNARVEEYSDYFDMTLMVKPFNANNNEMICDYSRASSIDIVPTVYQFACGNNQDFKSFEGFPLSSIPEDRMRKVFNLTMHPSLPPFEDIDGNPHPYNNCLREHNFDDLATFDWKTTFVRYIPWNSSVDIDESILTRYSFR